VIKIMKYIGKNMLKYRGIKSNLYVNRIYDAFRGLI